MLLSIAEAKVHLDAYRVKVSGNRILCNIQTRVGEPSHADNEATIKELAKF